MGLFGFSKPRTKFGKWMDNEGLSQKDVADICGIGRNTVMRLANHEDYKPTAAMVNNIVRKLKEAGYRASSSLFS